MHFKPTRHSEKKFKLSLSAIMRILPSSIMLGVLSVLLICSPALKGADINDLTYDASGAGVIITDCDTEASGELDVSETLRRRFVGKVEPND